MKVFEIIFLGPDGGIRRDVLSAEEFKVSVDGPFLKITKDKEGIVRIIPERYVKLVEFGESEPKPRLVTPAMVGALPSH